MITRWLLLVSCLLLALVAQPSTAKKSDGPKITATQFDHEPINLFYFEDSDTVIFQDADTSDIYRSFDGGEKWEVVDDEDSKMKGNVWTVIPHPNDKTKAYILGTQGRHWVTTDQAKTWRPFELSVIPLLMRSPLSFHGRDSNKVIFQGEECAGFHCFQRAFYTRDNFLTVSPLRDGSHMCSWAVGTPEFARDLEAADEIEDRVLCIVPGLKVPYVYANRLVYSDDYFTTDEEGIEAKLDQGRPISGIISTASVKKYLVAAAKSQGTDELALYVTDDTKVWHRAEFGDHKLEEDAYTVLESTNYSIQVDVLTTLPTSGMGVLFTSNSNGTYFTRNIEHTNRSPGGLVDFEKIANIQGIVLVNVVDNWEEVEKTDATSKKIVSKISFDDGRTFQSLKVGDKSLHLHSVTAFANVGRVFSSPAPGIVMGVGNTGDHLKSYESGDLYVSDDAGVTWRKALDGSHKYEFGDQGAVIMAIQDKEKTDKIQFSIDHGKEWETAELKHKIHTRLLTTTPDSTSLKFILVGAVEKDLNREWIVYSIDFGGLHERKCGKDDFEKWPARLDENGEPDCLMGHKQFYRRRKADADCFIDEEFKDPEPIFEPCKCTIEDFECDYNFVRSEDRKKCVPARPLVPPKGACQKPSDKYVGPSGWRLIPGNACIRNGGENLDKDVERSCDEAATAPDGAVSATKYVFDAPRFGDFYYLERAPTSGGDDETIVLVTSDNELFITHDHGKNWKRALEGSKIREIVPHRYFNDHAFFLTDSKQAFWTVDRAHHLSEFEAPSPPNKDRVPTLGFHPQYKDWLIWTGHACTGLGCNSVASITKNRGAKWELLLRGVRKCDFMARDDRKDSENLIFCEQFENEDPDNGALQLVSSDNWFYESKVHFTKVVDFATMEEFVVVAARNPENEESLKVDTSVDARVFADAEFPPNFDVPVQKAYTVLDSSTHAVFLHVTVNNMEERAYGSIIKSNSNGTSYVLSIDAVNRNDNGYVDFEKMQGLEGVAVVNVVGNVKDVEKGQGKKFRTMITHNDGAQWTLLAPPSKDSEGKGYNCKTNNGKPTEKCALHLHGYTERRDPRATYASASAVGIMMGVGNVGEYLTNKQDGETFITRDGGITWKAVKKGSYLWEYGDQGSVIVIVEESKPTKVVYYSVDEGETWEEYQFSDVEMQIDVISTVPSDTSRNFLLWGRELGDKKKIATVNLDFSGLRDRLCNLEEDSAENEDYYLWEPKHPMQENNCLFGHIEQYHRKKPSAHCWNDWKQPHIHRIAQNCTCTREDYECDYNYEPQSDGSCALVPGLPKPDALAVCRDDPEAIEYWEPTGYRRIPLTTCQGGLQLDHIVSKPCPNKEKEYEKKHGISGVGLFFAIVTPIAVAAGAGYWIYTKWDGKFGQIRLGENVGGADGMFSRDSSLVTVPIAIIAGIVAVAKALPLLGMSLWRSVSGYVRLPGRGGIGSQRPYSSRGAFAARRGDYASVVEDEDELLGVEDLEGEEDEEV
ncbi:hypothetical protein DTO027B5_7688 [Paecilomyces variotii]|nr:hypothetical protein DTO169E5_9189 [Paecilomyces variotii]KAJ9251093.1 hypothetical protein DTO207G8_5646 [Paecilomyces variotii]KAJ9323885.1 hypothetical protein DTO027B3_5234 [Paecilomyces variotii]KAJ9330597.1 hypothetical protein DTO027B5_7688 [Paecilomyces variotii]KAJ9382460.1 hypothetical protein DTO063F5_5636 [Paecilomyces variotii]